MENEDTEVADPATIKGNALYYLERTNEHARVFRKLFKLSSFDRETNDQINTAIEQTIRKWRLTQAALNQKEPRLMERRQQCET